MKIGLLLCAALVMAGCARTPQQREARFLELGKKLLAKKDYSRAGLEFRNAIQQAPADAEPYYQLGLTYFGAGDRGAALGCFREATKLNPKHAEAQLKLAGMLAAAHDAAAVADAETRAQGVASEFPNNVEALNTLATTELRLGKPEVAAEHLEQALKQLPGSLESAALLMRARLSEGDAKGAEAALMQCFQKSPDSAEVALVMGRFYLVTQRLALAQEQFRRAIRIDPRYGAAMLDLGMTLFHDGKQADAGPVFRQLAALPGKNYKPVYAIYLLETGQREAAIAELERLAKEDPSDRTARTRLVKMYLAAGRKADAKRLLARVIAENPKDADALLQRSEISLGEGQYQQAQDDLNLVLRYRPEAAEAHLAMARVDGAMGKQLHQRQELDEAVRLDPGLAEARLDLAKLLIASKGASAALETLHQAPEAQRRTAAFLAQTNWALMELGRFDEARQGVAGGLRVEQLPDLWLQDALLKVNARDYAGARASIDRVLRSNPEDVRALRALMQAAGVRAVREYAASHAKSAAVQNYAGEALTAAGDTGAARAAFQQAVADDGHCEAARFSLARLDAAEGKLEAAHRTLADMLSARPKDPEVWLYVGWLANLEKNYPRAIEYFRKVVDAEPGNVVALNNLAYLLAGQNGQFDEALKYAQQVKEIAPDNKGVDDTIGWILYRKGLYRSAVKYLESAAEGPADPVIRYHLGMAYLKAGDKRGEPTLRAALKSAPGLPEARMAEQLIGTR